MTACAPFCIPMPDMRSMCGACRSLPERAELGRIGKNAEAAQASWTTLVEFLR
jgi:hypothetical protein